MKNLSLGIAAAAFSIAGLGGCASTASIEAQQLAYDGSGPNPCTFGGITPRADAHCAEVNFGIEGRLVSVNDAVMHSLPKSADCKDHVARVEQELAGLSGVHTEKIYSCPDGQPSGVCHVSLLVKDAGGRQYVVDNGAVLDSSAYETHVASLQDFSDRVHGVYWIGKTPNEVQARGIAGVFAGFTPIIEAPAQP